MPAGMLNEVLEIGASYYRLFTITNQATGTPFDLTNYTANLSVSIQPGNTIILTANSVNGYAVTGGIAGTVAVSIPASVTSALTAGGYQFCLQIYNSSLPETIDVVVGAFRFVQYVI